MDFRAIFAALQGIGYEGYVSIGLDPDGDERARQSIAWLNGRIEQG